MGIAIIKFVIVPPDRFKKAAKKKETAQNKWAYAGHCGLKDTKTTI